MSPESRAIPEPVPFSPCLRKIALGGVSLYGRLINRSEEVSMPGKTTWMAVAWITVLAIAATVVAQTPAPPPVPAPPLAPTPAAVPLEEPAAIEQEPLPARKLEGPLDEILNQIKDNAKGFNTVIVRSPGVPDSYPTLAPLTANGVTIGQFLQFIKTSYPGVEISRIDGPKDPLYVIRISLGNNQPWQLPGMPGNGQPVDPATGAGIGFTLPPTVKVYPLGNIVRALAEGRTGNGDHTKQALDDVLSLVQATLDQAGATKDQTSIKVHEPTLSLVFRGSPDKIALLDQLLATLEPKQDDSKLGKMRQEMEELMKRNDASRMGDRESIDILRQQLQERTVQMEHEAAELAASRAQMEEMKRMQSQQDAATKAKNNP
jgi:hypothetical protein